VLEENPTVKEGLMVYWMTTLGYAWMRKRNIRAEALD